MPPRRRTPASPFRRRGVGHSADVRGQTFDVTARRPTVRVTKEAGFNVMTRTVGPRRRRRIVI